MKTLTRSATLTDADGYTQHTDITINDHGDTISLNGVEHLKSDMLISDRKITSKLAGWEVSW